MKAFYYLSAYFCLASWTDHASAFVIPTTKNCRSVGCWPTATVVSMTNDAANDEDKSSPLEEKAAVEPVFQSSNEDETETPDNVEMTDNATSEKTEDASSEEQTTIEAALESGNDEETRSAEKTPADPEDDEALVESEAGPVEEESMTEPIINSSSDAETEVPDESKSDAVEEESMTEPILDSSSEAESKVPEESEAEPVEEESTIEPILDSSTDAEIEVPDESKSDPVEEETASEPVLQSSTDEESKVSKKNEAKAEAKKDIPWMELLGAAAELAGAIGGAAAKAAAATLDDMTPKEVIDVSIPYDAASSLAYSEWLAKYDKEDPELERYDYFKKNYRAVVISNVIAKKMIREGIPEGETPPELLKLNQYADLSTEEYLEVQKSLEPKSWSDLFGELASVAGKAAMDMASGSSASAKAETETKPSVASKKAPAKKSVFKKSAVKKATAKKATAKETSKAESGFSFFGIGTKSVKKPSQAKKQPPRRAITKTAPAKKKVAQVTKVSGIPVLSRWKQNKDGSLTGFVSNSSSYRSGTRITTSPVPKGAEGGMVVRTGSGSRYKLK